ncbi:MAG: hypothetical protein GXY44_10980 [Phycisphaerales bacterium]|nr:hypothetical protein [Phycisphaerales bacterium]
MKSVSLSWLSNDGVNWGDRHDIGDPDFWLWRATWHEGNAYIIAKGEHTQLGSLRLYKSSDGQVFETYVKTIVDNAHPAMKGYRKPSETALVFMDDGTAYCLTRVGGAMIGSSRPPYKEWRWKNTGISVGGPNLIKLPCGRLVAGGRFYYPQRTSLAWVDPDAATLREFLVLPSDGDSSYPGFAWHEEMLWVSYYSSHEGKSNIYLAKVKIK